MKTPDLGDIEKYVDAQAALQDLPLSAAQRQGVIQNFGMALRIVAPLLDAQLPAGAEPAQQFKA